MKKNLFYFEVVDGEGNPTNGIRYKSRQSALLFCAGANNRYIVSRAKPIPNDLDVFKQMIAEDNKGLILSPYFVSLGPHEGGGIVSMGIAKELLPELFLNSANYEFRLFIVKKSEFFETQKSMMNGKQG